MTTGYREITIRSRDSRPKREKINAPSGASGRGCYPRRGDEKNIPTASPPVKGGLNP